jgi:hypothetical protein
LPKKLMALHSCPPNPLVLDVVHPACLPSPVPERLALPFAQKLPASGLAV